MRTTNILLSFLLLSAAGCTSDEQTDGPLANDKGEYAINFSGNLDMTLTKADPDPMGNGVKATISVYNSGDNVTNKSAIVSKGYTVGTTAGTFEGDDSYVMYLPKGDYDFYAVSTNSTTVAPEFTDGTSVELTNGVDYIYAKPSKTSVPTATDVKLEFQRKAVQIEITLKGSDSDGLTLTAWQTSNAATITPPVTTGCTMALSNGEIKAATSVDATENENVYKAKMTTGDVNNNKSTATYTMLPVATGQTLKVKFNVTVQVGGRTAEDKTYTANLTAPNNTDNGSDDAFKSGKKYTYTATLKANKITFTGATVSNWTSVAGTDLTPTEP